MGWGLSRPQGRRFALDQVLRLPWLAEKSAEFRLARFYRAVSLLLASGIALPRAMGMVTGLLSAAQRMRLAQARLAVEQGQSLSNALLAAGLASPVAESLIKVGERSGQLAEMLERTARFTVRGSCGNNRAARHGGSHPRGRHDRGGSAAVPG